MTPPHRSGAASTSESPSVGGRRSRPPGHHPLGVAPQLHADGRPGADGDGLGLAGSAPVRPVVGPPGRDLADSGGRRCGRDRDRARLGRAGVRPGRGMRDRLRARHGGLPPRGLEVRGLRQRPQARERDVALLGRGQSRVRARRARGGAAHPRARPARRDADRRAVPGRGRDPLLGPLVSARLRSGPRDDPARAGGRRLPLARTAAHGDHLPQPRLVRPAHVRAALGGVARPFQAVRHSRALGDAPRRRDRHAHRRAARRSHRAAYGAADRQYR